MANEIEQLKPISALAAIRDAKTHLDMALKPYAMRISAPLDYMDFGHVEDAQRILELLLEANRG